MPERSRWGTFCAMEQQACDLLVTASRMLGGRNSPALPEMRPSPSGNGKRRRTGSQVDALRSQGFGECAADAGAD